MSNILVELSNSMAEAVEKAAASTVLVNARRRMPASGIAYEDDLILTANHVVEREDGITVLLPDGSEAEARLAGRDPGSDLALLRLEKERLTPAEPANQARIGQIVLALGRPSQAGIEASLGVVSAMGGPVLTPNGSIDKYIRTDATPYPGFSGGPLVDADGRVVGLNTSGFGRGVTLTIPAETAWKIAEQLARSGSVKRGYLGVRSEPVELSDAAREALKRAQSTGLLLVSVERGSPAEAAKLIVGDILVGIDGQPVTEHDALFARLAGDVVGKPIPVEVLRGGKPQTFVVEIGARP
ncbi:MAG TPA: trypsin-like peptidase domain-containing protein [Anaerolineales bacterium]|nr:trypsin-like peptidase domain-containing protein [Anaerolineales bacterium]